MKADQEITRWAPSANTPHSLLHQALCTCWLLCLEYSSQIFEWLASLHSDLSSNRTSLKSLSSHPTSCFSSHFFAIMSPFLFPLQSWPLPEVTFFLFICFLVLCFPNAQYKVNTVTTGNLSSLFTAVVPVSRRIPGTKWTINNYSRQRFMKWHGSLKETCFKADYKIACNVRRENGI